MELNNIEKFFLNTVLKVSIAGVFLVLLSDALIYPDDTLSLIIDSTLLSACILAFLIRNTHSTISVLLLTSVVLLAMFYQCLVVPINTTTSLSIILVVGFVFSVMLKGRLMWLMHILTFVTINIIFVFQVINPGLRFSNKDSDGVTVAITYSILYFILTYATGVLKSSYDKVTRNLSEANDELNQKATEIETQNKELIRVQNNLNTLNKDLEKIVNERTKSLKDRTDKLIKYSYSNAHHLRGPIARLLGLIQIHKLEDKPDYTFFFNKIEDQAVEIDNVVKQINTELEGSDISNETKESE